MANVQVSTPQTTISDPKLIDPGIKKIWFDEFKELTSLIDQVFKVDTIEGAYEEEYTYSGYMGLVKIGELETYPEDAAVEGYGTTWTVSKYGTLIPVSYELWKFQRTKVVGNVDKIAKSARRSIEKDAASIFVNAFNSSYVSYGDGMPLCSTAHPSKGEGSTQSNASSTSIPLTAANLDLAIQEMMEQRDDRGNLLGIVPDTLLVPPRLLKTALEITKSELASAENEVNVYRLPEYTGGMLRVISWPYLGAAAGGSDTAWFLLDSQQHQVRFRWSEKLVVKMLSEDLGAKNDVYYWKARTMYAKGWSDWRGVWGSKGDGSIYTG